MKLLIYNLFINFLSDAPSSAANEDRMQPETMNQRGQFWRIQSSNKLVRYDLGPYIHTYIHTGLQATNNSVLFRYKAVRRTGRMHALNVSCSGPPIGVIQRIRPG